MTVTSDAPPHEDGTLPADLARAVDDFSRAGTILVATDFDGVVAPLVDRPEAARPVRGAVEVLVELAHLPGTHVAVVSGRDLETLTQLTGLDPSGPVTRIGSHGAQSSRSRAAGTLSPHESELLTQVTADLEDLLSAHPGARLEHKPTATVLHTRGGDAEVAAAAHSGAHAVASRHRGVNVLTGKDVVELSVVNADKGTALLTLADEMGADAVAYLGDDVTDEHAFEALGRRDLTVKVGEGETAARFRVHTHDEVLTVLRRILVSRR